MKGKNFANRKPENMRPANDFYPTPSCMVKELLKFDGTFGLYHSGNKILDPCCGHYAIGNVLREMGYGDYNFIAEKDIIYGDDFLKKDDKGEYTDTEEYDMVIMNPPFKLFDEFIIKSKMIANKVCSIGKVTFFGGHNRNVNGLWDNLEYVLIFDRQIAFDKPEINGKVECGMLVSGWFIWNKRYNGLPKIKVLDMQKYIRSNKDEK